MLLLINVSAVTLTAGFERANIDKFISLRRDGSRLSLIECVKHDSFLGVLKLIMSLGFCIAVTGLLKEEGWLRRRIGFANKKNAEAIERKDKKTYESRVAFLQKLFNSLIALLGENNSLVDQSGKLSGEELAEKIENCKSALLTGHRKPI